MIPHGVCVVFLFVRSMGYCNWLQMSSLSGHLNLYMYKNHVAVGEKNWKLYDGVIWDIIKAYKQHLHQTSHFVEFYLKNLTCLK